MIHLGDITKISGYTAPSLRNPQLEMMEMETERLRNKTTTNRDWLNSLSTVELVCWIKNTASAMADAELLRWMEEKHETD